MWIFGSATVSDVMPCAEQATRLRRENQITNRAIQDSYLWPQEFEISAQARANLEHVPADTTQKLPFVLGELSIYRVREQPPESSEPHGPESGRRREGHPESRDAK